MENKAVRIRYDVAVLRAIMLTVRIFVGLLCGTVEVQFVVF